MVGVAAVAVLESSSLADEVFAADDDASFFSFSVISVSAWNNNVGNLVSGCTIPRMILTSYRERTWLVGLWVDSFDIIERDWTKWWLEFGILIRAAIMDVIIYTTSRCADTLLWWPHDNDRDACLCGGDIQDRPLIEAAASLSTNLLVLASTSIITSIHLCSIIGWSHNCWFWILWHQSIVSRCWLPQATSKNINLKHTRMITYRLVFRHEWSSPMWDHQAMHCHSFRRKPYRTSTPYAVYFKVKSYGVWAKK